MLLSHVTHSYIHTCIRLKGFVVDPFDDLEAVLCSYNGDAWYTSNEVFQWNTTLELPFFSHCQRTELGCITLWKTDLKGLVMLFMFKQNDVYSSLNNTRLSICC